MGKRRKEGTDVEEQLDFQIPKFDEEAFIKKERRNIKTLFIAFLFGLLIALICFAFWVLLTPVLMIFGIAYGWRRWRIKGVAHIVLIDLFYAGLAMLWLIIVPRLTESPLSTVRFVHPELGYAVLASGVLGIGWSVIYTAMNLMTRRSK